MVWWYEPLVFTLVFSPVLAYLAQRWIGWALAIPILVGLPLAVAAMAARNVRRRWRDYVALCPDGIRARTANGDFKIPYDEIERISRYECWIQQRGKLRNLDLTYFLTESDMPEFIAAVDLARQDSAKP